jgi:hypothetical protein
MVTSRTVVLENLEIATLSETQDASTRVVETTGPAGQGAWLSSSRHKTNTPCQRKQDAGVARAAITKSEATSSRLKMSDISRCHWQPATESRCQWTAQSVVTVSVDRGAGCCGRRVREYHTMTHCPSTYVVHLAPTLLTHLNHEGTAQKANKQSHSDANNRSGAIKDRSK